MVQYHILTADQLVGTQAWSGETSESGRLELGRLKLGILELGRLELGRLESGRLESREIGSGGHEWWS